MADSILELIRKSTEFLARKGLENPRMEAELLLSHLLGVSRIQLYVKFDEILSEDIKIQYRTFIMERAKRKPFAYLVGYKDFRNIRLRITDSVLIPRPETEELVELFLSQAKSAQTLPAGPILDLCCGSGCIGLSLKQAMPERPLVLSDIEAAALSVAGENAALLFPTAQDDISFCESDLFDGVPTGPYAAILTNPPYIHPDEKKDLEPDVVHYEPESALFHHDPPALYNRIIQEASRRLFPSGLFIAELSPRWAHGCLETAGALFSESRIVLDSFGKERFLLARR